MPPQTQKIDYNALADQARQAAPPPAAGPVDYAAMAAQARGDSAPAAAAPPPVPQTMTQKLLGVDPMATVSSVGSHLKSMVAGPYHAFTDAPRTPEEQNIKGATPADGGAANSLGQFGLGVARMFVQPTVDGLKTANAQRKAGNTSLKAPEYDAQGNYTPTAASSVMDAIPLVGPWARGIDTEAHQRGVLPAMAGLATDVGVPEAVAKLAGPTMAGVAKLPDRLIRKPLTAAADEPLAGSTITPRQRYNSAKRIGVQYDAADATGSPALGIVKKVSRDSLVGSPVYDKAAASNTAAVRGATTSALTDMSPLEPAQGGALIQNNLRANQAALKDSATGKFNQLDESTGGQPIPGAAQVGSDAQTILQNEAPFYAKYPSMRPGTAMNTLEDLGKVGDTASYSELQRLRSATHEITSANNDLVKEPGTAMLQQMTGSLDNAITDKGLSPEQASLFRDANGDWADMKEQYDSPQSPLYSAVRTPNPSSLSSGVGSKTPEMLDNLRPRIGDEGMGALQRGNTENLLGKTALDDYNFKTFGRKLYSQPDAYRQSLYGPEMSGRLDDIARTTQGLGTDFNPSGSAKQVQKVGEGASLLSTFKGNPLGPAPLLQYPVAKLMNSPKVVDWLMRQPGEAAGGAGGGGVIPPPAGYDQNGPTVDKYGYKLPPPDEAPAATPALRPDRPQPTAPQRPYAPQVRRDSNIRDIEPLTPKGKPAAPQAQLSLGDQGPAAEPNWVRGTPISNPTPPPEVQVKQAAAPLAPTGPDLDHLNQQTPALDGAKTDLHTADGVLPSQYRVMEANTLIPSHNASSFRPTPGYPEGVQERDYFGNRENQLRVIQNAQNYKPAMTISDNPDGINGPPVVTPNGVVLGGNSRVMSTQRLYAKDGSAYKDYLKSKAGQFGMDPEDIDQMKQPVLVRQVQSDGTTEGLHKLGSQLNKPLTGALSSTERAVSMGKGLSPDTISAVRGMLQEHGDGATLRDVMGNPSKSNALLMRMQSDGLIGREERPQYVDTATGGMNEEGKRVFEKALMGSVMGDANLMETAPKNVTAKLNASIGTLSELASRPDAWNVIPQLRTAIGEHTKMAAANMSTDDYLKQGSMFGKPLTPVEEHLTRVLGGNQNAVRDSFNSYGKDARYSLPGQSTFLGPEPHDAFNHAFKATLGPEQFANVKPLKK